MATVSRTWGVQDTLLDPQALSPPPVRHALLVFLITLTAILHLGTTGWSDIQNGIEGEYAGGARQMLGADGGGSVPVHGGTLSPNRPPLFQWIAGASLKLFGIMPMAAHVPGALAIVGSVTLTFLIGERLGGYWRGFVAGLLQLCSLGAFVWGRIATPEPLFSAITEAALFCIICGYQRRQHRQFWFGGFWLCAAVGFLAKGLFAVVFLGGILLLMALLFREARLRFRGLFHWACLAPFVLIAAGWVVWAYRHGGAFLLVSSDPAGRSDGISPLLLSHVSLWCFPAVLLAAPGILFAWRKVLRPHEFDFADALPLCWIGIAVTALLLSRADTTARSMMVLPGFALCAAVAWERSSLNLRMVGLACLALGYAALGFALPSGSLLWWFGSNPLNETDLHLRLPALAIAGGIASLAAAAYFGRGDRERLAICIATLGVLPLGLSVAEAIAQLGPQLSFAPAARLVQERLGEKGEVIYDGSPSSGSSLEFYLDRQPFFAGRSERRHAVISTEEAVDRMGGPHPVYLFIAKERATFWQEQLTARYHIYHQVSTCGQHIVVTNQP